MRLSQRGLQNIRRGLKRSWADGSHRERFQRGEPDADTLRQQALHDRKGQFYCAVRVPAGTFEVRWSVLGRTDQLDVFDPNGIKVATCRLGLVLSSIAACHD